jgi:signal transduction histidine kinase/ActR/RegA family two-component response regulator
MSETDKHSKHITSLPDTSGSQHVEHGQSLRRQAEEIFREKTAGAPGNRDALLSEEIREIIRELQVHQIELEIQNEQLRQTQEELEAARSRYFDLYDQAPVGYCTLNNEGVITEANVTVADMLGVARTELVGQPLSTFILREDQDNYYLFRRQFAESPMPSSGATYIHPEKPSEQRGCDLRMINKGKTAFFWAHLQVNTLQDPEGTPVFLLALSDITERKEAETLRIKLEAKSHLVQKAESLERMAGAIAHLFNNQLYIVIGNLELTLDEMGADASCKFREKLIEALQATHRSAEVSRLMLAYLGHHNVKLNPLDLSETCRRELTEIKLKIPSSVPMRTSFISPGPVVLANTNQIRQIFANLITNGSDAIQACPGGGEIKITTKSISASSISRSDIFSTDWVPFAEEFACLEVTDTGCGMSKKEVTQIFDPFYSTKDTGRGLGLAIAKGLVKSWGGMISVETAVGSGSRFRVFLPLAADAVDLQATEPTGTGDFESEGTVLLVDDDKVVRKLAETVLQRLGFTVLSAASGHEAVDVFKKHRDSIKCLLTDLSMPGMDGWETLKALRKIRPHLPAILSSGYDENQVMAGDHRERPQAFLPKPYTMANLKEVLRQVLRDAK